MTEGTADQKLDKLARLYFRLLDLSRDVDRNRDDTEYQDNGGKIWYVFDATVLEVFINVQDPRGCAASLYAPEWGVPSVMSLDARSRAAQTALACTEYLLGGSLPSQHRSTVYMTEWHRWEFQRRVKDIQLLQIRKLGATHSKRLRGRFSEVTNLLRHLDRDPKAYLTHISDKQLLNDLAEFETKNPDADEFKTFVSTRMSLEILAEDIILEPARQLSRLVTAPLRHNFTTLHLALPPTKEELVDIAKDAVRWMTRLHKECAKRGIRVTKGNSGSESEHGGVRHEQALSNDAYTLAMVRWAARKKAQTIDERIVLVTADHVMFDTYRSWYAGLQLHDPAYNEPFALRRLIQYAPIFNLVSSGRLDGDQYRELFQELQSVLEKISAPLNLSLLTRNKAPIVERMLELTALRLNDPRNIGDDIAYLPLIQMLRRDFKLYRRDLEQVIKRWRDLERAALGRAGDAVQHRIQRAHKADELLLGLDVDATNSAYHRLLQDLVQSLVTGPQDVSLNMAREYLNSWPHVGRHLARAPIALRIEIETPFGLLDIGERLDRRLAGELIGDFLENEEQWQALYAQPALLFAIASAHCVASNDWTNAQQFVEIALKGDADSNVEKYERAKGDQLAEIKYLAALVYRFRLGEIAPPLTGEGYGRMNRFYHQAKRQIDWCENYHLITDIQHPLRLMRARSERAALNLFYASALNTHVRMAHLRRQVTPQASLGDICPPSSPDPNMLLDFQANKNAIAALERAELDLLSCLVAARELTVEASSPRAIFLGRLVRQSTTNVCAAALLRVLWGLDFETSPTLLRPGNSEAIAAARKRLAQFGDASPTMMHADILGFLTLSGSEPDAKDLECLPSIDILPGNLSLDAAFVDAIRSNIARFRRVAKELTHAPFASGSSTLLPIAINRTESML